MPLRRAGGAGAAAPAWRAVFRRTPAAWAAPDPGDGDDDGASGTPTAASARASTSGGGSLRKLRRDEPPRLLQKRRERPVVARKVSRVPLPLDARPADYDSDAIDAALSVDGSVAPSECGSDATSAFAGADGFENIAASRAAAARAERARAEGDVPWVRWWDRRAQAYDRLVASQPILQELCDRVAPGGAALGAGAGEPAAAARGRGPGGGRGPHLPGRSRGTAGGPCARAPTTRRTPAALARARAGARPRPASRKRCGRPPVERCAERLPARLRGAADCVTCRGARRRRSTSTTCSRRRRRCSSRAAASSSTWSTASRGRAWEDHVRDALRAAGVAAPADVARARALAAAGAAPRARRPSSRRPPPPRACGSPRATPSTRRGRRLLRGLAVGVVVVARGDAGAGGRRPRRESRVARARCIWTRRGARPRLRGSTRTALVVVLKPDALADDDSPENGVARPRAAAALHRGIRRMCTCNACARALT